MKIGISILFSIITLNLFAGVGGSIGGSTGADRSLSLGKRLITLQDFDDSLSHIVHWPEIDFPNIKIPVKNICTEGNTLKTISPVKVCAQKAVVEICEKVGPKGLSEECHKVRPGESLKESYTKRLVYGCTTFMEKNLETSKFYEVPVCIKWREKTDEAKNHSRAWDCTEYNKETKEYPETYKISVTDSSINHNSTQNVEIKIKFDIKECEQ